MLDKDASKVECYDDDTCNDITLEVRLDVLDIDCECKADRLSERSNDASVGWWTKWVREDEEGALQWGGGITAEEFCSEGGLLQWIVEHIKELRCEEKTGEPPKFKS